MHSISTYCSPFMSTDIHRKIVLKYVEVQMTRFEEGDHIAKRRVNQKDFPQEKKY